MFHQKVQDSLENFLFQLYGALFSLITRAPLFMLSEVLVLRLYPDVRESGMRTLILGRSLTRQFTVVDH